MLLATNPDLADASEYTLTWHDEFNDSINVNNDYDENWQFQYCSFWTKDLQLDRTSNTVAVRSDGEDSYLSLRTVKTDEVYTAEDGKTYSVYNSSVPITTCGKMSYLYGYLEIRASVPYGESFCPSFWLKSTNAQYRDEETETFVGDTKLGYVSDALYDTEVDVFEVMGTNSLRPNIHKWWKPFTQTYADRTAIGHSSGEQRANKTVAKTYDISFGKEYSIEEKQWHTYGFEWTEDEMNFYVDGVIYETFDLNENFGADENGYGMTGFKESPLSVILSSKIYTQYLLDSGESTKTPVDDSAYEAGDIVSEMAIDYIRLYQKEDGKLWTK